MSDIPRPVHEGAREAEFELRRAERDSSAGARALSTRLSEVDQHQRQARWVLEHAGMLTRRPRTG